MDKTKSENERLITILKVTKDLIRDKGCVDTTMTDIIRESETSKGGIYHYVSSKDQLYALILEKNMEEINQDFHDQVENTKEGIDEPLGVIAKGLSGQSKDYYVNAEIFTYLLSKSKDPDIGQILENLYRQFLDLASQWISLGQDYGLIKKDLDPKETGRHFISLAYGNMVIGLIDQASQGPNYQDYYDYMYAYLKNPQGPSDVK